MRMTVAVRIFGVLVLWLSAFAMRASAQSMYDAIREYSCEPTDCYSDIGPTTTGGTFTTITGDCNNGNSLGTLVALIDIEGECSVPIIIGTSGSALNILEVEDDGCGGFISYYLGEMSANAQVLNTVTGKTVYNQSRSVDCIGGLTPPMTPWNGTC